LRLGANYLAGRRGTIVKATLKNKPGDRWPSRRKLRIKARRL
jgi:hypothetical protein